MDTQARWQGRNEHKDALRRSVWGALESAGAAVGNPWSRIPDFVGAEAAAARLADLPCFSAARIVKSNPDKAQAPFRRMALEAGKLLYAPVPELMRDYPFVELDPEELSRRNIAFEEASLSETFIEIGRPMQFTEMRPMDMLVVGCVAVTRAGGRTGKGAGFADLELGIFRALDLVPSHAQIVTSVHDVQVVPDSDILMLAHDQPLHAIATPSALILTGAAIATPSAIDWDRVQPDQYAAIPFLRELRSRLETRTSA